MNSLSKMGANIPGDRCTGRLWKAVVTDHGRMCEWHLVSYLFRSLYSSNSLVLVRLSSFISIHRASVEVLDFSLVMLLTTGLASSGRCFFGRKCLFDRSSS